MGRPYEEDDDNRSFKFGVAMNARIPCFPTCNFFREG